MGEMNHYPLARIQRRNAEKIQAKLNRGLEQISIKSCESKRQCNIGTSLILKAKTEEQRKHEAIFFIMTSLTRIEELLQLEVLKKMIKSIKTGIRQRLGYGQSLNEIISNANLKFERFQRTYKSYYGEIPANPLPFCLT